MPKKNNGEVATHNSHPFRMTFNPTKEGVAYSTVWYKASECIRYNAYHNPSFPEYERAAKVARYEGEVPRA